MALELKIVIIAEDILKIFGSGFGQVEILVFDMVTNFTLGTGRETDKI